MAIKNHNNWTDCNWSEHWRKREERARARISIDPYKHRLFHILFIHFFFYWVYFSQFRHVFFVFTAAHFYLVNSLLRCILMWRWKGFRIIRRWTGFLTFILSFSRFVFVSFRFDSLRFVWWLSYTPQMPNRYKACDLSIPSQHTTQSYPYARTWFKYQINRIPNDNIDPISCHFLKV